MDWAEIKKSGSQHYKQSDGLEPIDLYKSIGTLQDWVVCEAVHHLLRNISKLDTLRTQKCLDDMAKVIHYANIIICLAEEAQTEQVTEQVTGEAPGKSNIDTSHRYVDGGDIAKNQFLGKKEVCSKPDHVKCGATWGSMACLDTGLGEPCNFWGAK